VARERRYEIELTPAAQRDLAGIKDRTVLRRLDARILALGEDPHPPGLEKLEGPDGFLGVPVGDYRIIYQVETQRLVVLVVKIGHRRGVYRTR
jgi:mRNA interferase RelE/StbE